MLDYLPDWVKALIGTGMLLYIFIVGFKNTSKSEKTTKAPPPAESKDSNNTGT